jgi:hypothetical protein
MVWKFTIHKRHMGLACDLRNSSKRSFRYMRQVGDKKNIRTKQCILSQTSKVEEIWSDSLDQERKRGVLDI